MELSATGKVIIGMLAARPRSGYEIKQLVDKSARFFWAASYGQIYPELKRLEEAGLIKGSDASQGARQRKVYKLTAQGRRAAEAGIARAPELSELRDEGLLQLFFAGSIEPARTAEIARESAAKAAATAAELRGLQEEIAREHEAAGPEYSPDPGSLTVLRYGIELNEWAAEWFDRAAEDLERETTGAVTAARGREDMVNSLASLAQRHGKRTVIIAAIFFVVAGALGGGVASKLGPYGADDPATESVKATDRLEADGYRDPGVIVLLSNASPTSKAGQERIQGVQRQLRGNPAVAHVTGYLETQNRDFVSKDGSATYLAVSLKPTDDKAEQDAAKAIADDLSGQPGVQVGGIALAQEQVNKQVEKDLRMAE